MLVCERDDLVDGIIDVQGETIDRVENDIIQSAAYVESAKEDTKTAVKYQTKARRVSF